METIFPSASGSIVFIRYLDCSTEELVACWTGGGENDGDPKASELGSRT